MNLVFQVLTFVQSQFSKKFNLISTDRLILINLSSFVGGNDTCWHSIKTIAQKCHIDERQLHRRLKHLSEQKLIEIIHHPGARSEYKINNSLMQSSVLEDQNRAINDQKVIHNPGHIDHGLDDEPLTSRPPHPGHLGHHPPPKNEVIPLIYKSNNKLTIKTRARARKPRRASDLKTDSFLTNLPEWLKPEIWSEFIQHRRDIKKPLTALANKKAISFLTKCKEEGHDIDQIINNSIMNRWQGLFEPPGKGNQNAKPKDSHYKSLFEKDGLFPNGYDPELDIWSNEYNPEKAAAVRARTH